MTRHTKRPNEALPLPGGFEVQLMPSGVAWDAVRLPEPLGTHVRDLLGDNGGAVIDDPQGSCHYWLIPLAAELDWNAFPETADVRHLGTACWVTVPGAERRAAPGPHWIVPCRDGHALTDPQTLHHAVAIAVEMTPGLDPGATGLPENGL